VTIGSVTIKPSEDPVKKVVEILRTQGPVEYTTFVVGKTIHQSPNVLKFNRELFVVEVLRSDRVSYRSLRKDEVRPETVLTRYLAGVPYQQLLEMWLTKAKQARLSVSERMTTYRSGARLALVIINGLEWEIVRGFGAHEGYICAIR